MSTAEQITPASAAGEDESTAALSSSGVQDPAEAAKAEPSAAEPASGKASTPVPAEKPDVTKDVARMLMTGKIDGVEAAKPDPVAPASSAPTATEVAPVLDLPVVRHPYDDPEDPNEADIDGRASEKTRAGFEKLKNRLRSAREEGAFGSMVIETARSHGLDPETVAAIIGLSARASKGDTQATTQLQQVMGKLGISGLPPAAPAIDQATLLEVEANKVYKSLFEADVKSADMDEGKAREKAALIAKERLEARALSQPVPSNPPPPQSRQEQPAGRQMTAMQQAAHNAVVQLADKYDAAYKKAGADFEPVRKEAQAAIAEKVKRDGPINPLYWEYEFAQAVTAVQKKRAAPAKPAVATSTGLRPSGGAGASGGSSKNDFRQDIVSKLVSGQIDKI